MKIKPTTTLVKELKAYLKTDDKHKYIKRISREKLTVEQMRYYVDMFIDDNVSDYDISTNRFNVIRVSYDDELFACDTWLTTKRLREIVDVMKNRGDELTVDNYIKNVVEALEI